MVACHVSNFWNEVENDNESNIVFLVIAFGSFCFVFLRKILFWVLGLNHLD